MKLFKTFFPLGKTETITEEIEITSVVKFIGYGYKFYSGSQYWGILSTQVMGCLNNCGIIIRDESTVYHLSNQERLRSAAETKMYLYHAESTLSYSSEVELVDIATQLKTSAERTLRMEYVLIRGLHNNNESLNQQIFEVFDKIVESLYFNAIDTITPKFDGYLMKFKNGASIALFSDSYGLELLDHKKELHEYITVDEVIEYLKGNFKED